MNNRKFLIVISVIVLILSIVLFTKQINATSVEEKFNANDIVTKENSLNYSEAYKQWLKLSDEEKASCDVIPRKYDVPLDSIYEDTVTVKESPSLFNLFGLFARTSIVSTYADEIPETFNLNDKISIKPKDQGSYGLCWAFTCLRSLETNLLLNEYGEYDFSELHLDYLTYMRGLRDSLRGRWKL